MNLSIIIPAYNEEENIARVIEKVENTLDFDYELIVVNDHSQDATSSLVSNLTKKYQNLRLVHNLNERGFANALRAGFANVKTDAAVAVMADLCDDIASIKKMFGRFTNENCDIVCASRYIKDGARIGGSNLKAFLSSTAGKTLNLFLGIPTTDIANSFKMYRKSILNSVKLNANGFEISMEITLKAYYSGAKITEIPTVWNERTKGKSSFKIFKLLPNYIKLYIWAFLQNKPTNKRSELPINKRTD